MTRLHDDEIEVDEGLVRRLLGTVSAAYDELPLRRFEVTGSTNALFRLGDDLLVRVPRQPGGTETIEKEQRWLPYVAPHLPVATPEIVAVGDPGFGYPEKWSVVRYLEGDQPALPEPDQPPTATMSLSAGYRSFRRRSSAKLPPSVARGAAVESHWPMSRHGSPNANRPPSSMRAKA